MTNGQPKIYQAIHDILSEMKVEKNGQLPSNMGSAKYATAEAVSNATKNLFIDNKLILVPEEEVADISTPDFGDKKSRFMVTIRGNYQVVHIEDGSSINFSGVGQGLATGTAVAANIASTFALKNALQRMFLISEESVDTAGHTEQVQPRQTEAQRRVQQAPVRRNPNAEALEELKAFMRKYDVDSTVMAKKNQEIATKLGKDKAEVYPELLEELKKEYTD